MKITNKINFKKLFDSAIFINGVILFVLSVILFFLTDRYIIHDDDEFIQQLIYTAYGMLLDIAIIGILITWLNERRENKYRIQSYQNEIDDFRNWVSEEAMLRTVGNIKRLNKNDITEIDLVDCTLRNINLNGVDLTNSNLNSADFSHSSLMGIILNDCRMNQSKFENSNLNSAELIKSFATGTNFKDSYLIKANFEGSYLIKSTFENAYLIEANLKNTILSDVNFRNASLYKADLTGAIGLKAEQLLKVKSLYLTKLDNHIIERLKIIAPYLLTA